MGLALLAVLPALSSSAAAKPGYYVMPGYGYAELTVKGSHGYTVQIDQQQHGGAFALASRKTDVVAYELLRNGWRPGEMRMHFPGIGRIEARFHRHDLTHRKEEWPDCKGGEETIETGVFTGTIRLRGEKAFTVVDAKRAKGKLVTVEREVCERSPGSHGHSDAGPSVVAAAHTRAGELAFYAHEFQPDFLGGPSLLVFSASLLHRKDGMVVLNRTSAVSEDPVSLQIEPGPKPKLATVVPPSPFTGSATFSRVADGSLTWTGDLEASLPGIGAVTLTGPEFKPTLCVHRKCQGYSKGRLVLDRGKLRLP